MLQASRPAAIRDYCFFAVNSFNAAIRLPPLPSPPSRVRLPVSVSPSTVASYFHFISPRCVVVTV